MIETDLPEHLAVVVNTGEDGIHRLSGGVGVIVAPGEGAVVGVDTPCPEHFVKIRRPEEILVTVAGKRALGQHLETEVLVHFIGIGPFVTDAGFGGGAIPDVGVPAICHFLGGGDLLLDLPAGDRLTEDLRRLFVGEALCGDIAIDGLDLPAGESVGGKTVLGEEGDGSLVLLGLSDDGGHADARDKEKGEAGGCHPPKISAGALFFGLAIQRFGYVLLVDAAEDIGHLIPVHRDTPSPVR